MANDNKVSNPSLKTAAIGGGIIGLLLLVVGAGLLIAVLAGVAIFALGLFLLPRKSGHTSEETHVVREPVEQDAETPVQSSAPIAAETVAAVSEPEIDTQPAEIETAPVEELPQEESSHSNSASDVIKASKVLPGQQELAARKGTWRFEGSAGTA